MISLATAEPPGESTRRTTALMVSSRAASSSALRTSVLNAPSPPGPKGEISLVPELDRPVHVDDADGRLVGLLLLRLGHRVAEQLEDGERVGEVELRRLLLAVLAVEDDVVAVLVI